MSDLTRLSISLEKNLLIEFDRYCQQAKFTCRSAAIRQLLHERLALRDWEEGTGKATVTLTLVYDPGTLVLYRQLTKLKRRYVAVVLSSLQVLLDDGMCVESVILTGPARRVRIASDKLCSLRGLRNAHRTVAAGTGRRHDDIH